MPKAVTPKKFGAPLGMYSHGMVAPGGVGIALPARVWTWSVSAFHCERMTAMANSAFSPPPSGMFW